ncbi:fanconi-associated nuclease 1-like isoform X2 [Dendronephthya gigantea]|uniref:fanconi-associated nuclease 1-like isoform X2 n=1 Tax=Dendronephthya gigantea TaxID=151771 RepID=UPI0010690C5A|nr:fanconi-associated nuclease 1-like isoform X2 [Dendronephthya gigantea]
METLLRRSKTQCSLFSNNGNRIQKELVIRAKSLLGSCVKLDATIRNLFSRIVLLFTLNQLKDDDYSYGTNLAVLFLNNIGKVSFPDYEVSRSLAIFPDREALVSYDLAHQDVCEMGIFLGSKNSDVAEKIFVKVHPRFSEMLEKLVVQEDPQIVHVLKLPVHLRCFSESWLLTKMCSLGVDLLQRNREYCAAVELLRQLLSQTEFCPNNRGWWWERLALNLDQHLKKPSEALDAVRNGLADTRVNTGRRLALEQRARRICEMKRNSSLKRYLNEIKFTELRQPKVVTISGKRLENEPTFMFKDVNADGFVDSVSFGRVEELALDYYKRQGYNRGIHGESFTYRNIYSCLMWDIIFGCHVEADVFRTPFQSAPLDIYCENFYSNRKEIIDKRLDEIRSSSAEQLAEEIKSTWLEQEGKICVGEVTQCLGGEILAGICERFARNYHHTRSGMPDLFVWNSRTLKYKIVEVKGPNDKLSTKQEVWLDVLQSLGCETEVLCVKAVGGRRLLKSVQKV